jgi:hypothetical protein
MCTRAIKFIRLGSLPIGYPKTWGNKRINWERGMVVSNPYKVHTFQSQGDKTAPASEMADRFADIVGVEGEGRGLWE